MNTEDQNSTPKKKPTDTSPNANENEQKAEGTPKPAASGDPPVATPTAEERKAAVFLKLIGEDRLPNRPAEPDNSPLADLSATAASSQQASPAPSPSKSVTSPASPFKPKAPKRWQQPHPIVYNGKYETSPSSKEKDNTRIKADFTEPPKDLEKVKESTSKALEENAKYYLQNPDHLGKCIDCAKEISAASGNSVVPALLRLDCTDVKDGWCPSVAVFIPNDEDHADLFDFAQGRDTSLIPVITAARASPQSKHHAALTTTMAMHPRLSTNSPAATPPDELRYWIATPSFERADLARLNYRHTLGEHGRARHLVLVKPSQLAAYAVHWGNTHILVRLPEEEGAVSEARYFMQKVAEALGLDYLWCIDDSVYMMERMATDEAPMNGGMVKEKTDMRTALLFLESLVSESPPLGVLGVSQSLANVHVEATHRPALSFVLLNVAVAKKLGVHYRYAPSKPAGREDIDISDELEKNGFKSIRYTRIQHKDLQGLPGGCGEIWGGPQKRRTACQDFGKSAQVAEYRLAVMISKLIALMDLVGEDIYFMEIPWVAIEPLVWHGTVPEIGKLSLDDGVDTPEHHHSRKDCHVGNCQFEAVLQGLRSIRYDGVDELNADDLRRLAVWHIRRNADYYRPFLTSTIAEYTLHMERPGSVDRRTWGDHLTLRALSAVLNITITVQTPGSPPVHIGSDRAHVITVQYNGRDHYYSTTAKALQM